MPCGSFTVKYESIGIGNVRIVQKVFLTMAKVKRSRSSADTCKSARRVYVKDGPDSPIRSRLPGPISDIGPVGTKDIRLRKNVTSKSGPLKVIENDTF